MNEKSDIKTGRAGTFVRPMLGAAGIVLAMAGLLMGSQLHGHSQAERNLAENDDAMTESLVRVVHYYTLLHELGEGESHNIRQEFSDDLVREMARVQASLGAVSDDQREFAQHICLLVARDAAKHPGFYSVKIRQTLAGSPAMSASIQTCPKIIESKTTAHCIPQ